MALFQVTIERFHTGGNTIMQQIKKATTVFLSVLMAITVMPLSAFAAEENTPKEEVVYINFEVVN